MPDHAGIAEIPYTVRRSTRARRVRVNVHVHSGVEVVLPQNVPERAAAAAIAELRPWIERRLHEAGRALARISERGGTLPYLGVALTLIREPHRQRVRRQGDLLLIPTGEAAPAIERFYRRCARQEVSERLERACARTGHPYTTLTIRSQRTRWASCSASGAMSFNWRLLLAPERVLDYVVWHEVCHLQVLDHSPRFWALLADHWPSWRSERDWLRMYGATLVL